MNGSQTNPARRPVGAARVWLFALALAVLLALGMLVSHQSTVLETFHWVGQAAEIRQADGSWIAGHVREIGSGDGIQELRLSVRIDEDPKWAEPVGVNLAGPFSAELYWDDELIGRKGVVGEDAASETPGSIDSITLVPAHRLQPGTHQLRIRLSAHHATPQPKRIIHVLGLGPYRGDDRRLLRYYALPILLLSGLLSMVVQNLRIGISAGNRLYIGLGWFGIWVLLSLLSEVARALINYPYHLHEVRSTLMWLASIGAGLALNLTCVALHPQRWVKLALIGGALLGVASGLIGLGGDLQIARNFLALVATPALLQLWLLRQGQISYYAMLPIYWLACLLSYTLSIGVFLDSYYFVAAIIFLGGAWFWVYIEKPASKPVPGAGHLVVKSKGKALYVPAAEIVFLKAEGNFTLLTKLDGSTLLHQSALGKIMQQPPPGFIRVHKSYAVNRAHTGVLRSAAGSKYWLETKQAGEVPVSRYRVAEVRAALAR